MPKRSKRKETKHELSGLQVVIFSRNMGNNPNKLCLVAFACDLAKDNSVRVLTFKKLHPVTKKVTLGIPQDRELMQRLR